MSGLDHGTDFSGSETERGAGERGDGVKYLRRPGKKDGVSGTWGAVGPGKFYNFSSNGAPFEPYTEYNPFAVYATLEQNGDFAAAAKSLGQRFEPKEKQILKREEAE